MDACFFMGSPVEIANTRVEAANTRVEKENTRVEANHTPLLNEKLKTPPPSIRFSPTKKARQHPPDSFILPLLENLLDHPFHLFFSFNHHCDNQIRIDKAITDKPCVLLASFIRGSAFAGEFCAQFRVGIA